MFLLCITIVRYYFLVGELSMGITLDDLKGKYVFKDLTIGFSQGRRSILRYACENGYAWHTQINFEGPQPFEYLNFAKNNIALGNTQGAIDGLSNAKRAIHLTIDALFDIWGLSNTYKKANFPAKLELMSNLDAFPVRMLNSLNQRRNLVEHEYKTIQIDEAADFVEVCEMFLMVAYPYLKHSTISAQVGLDNDNRCLEWQFDIENNQFLVSEIAGCPFFESSVGRIYYNLPHNDKNKRVIQTVNFEKSKQNDWYVFLELFVYLTKKNAHQLEEPDSRGHGLYIGRSFFHFNDSDKE